MILQGLSSTVLVATPGRLGITPAQISLAGDEDSPLLNDVDPGDDLLRMIWVLLPPLAASGTTLVDDAGGYALLAPAVGVWVQHYRLLAMPATGAPVVQTETITTIVDAPVGPTVTPRRRQVVGNVSTAIRPGQFARN